MPAGRPQVDGLGGQEDPLGGGHGHFAGAVAAGVRAGAALARRGGGAGLDAAQARGVVPAVADGEPRRQIAGHGQRGGLRAADSEPRAQFVPQASLRRAGGRVYAGAVRNADGSAWGERASPVTFAGTTCQSHHKGLSWLLLGYYRCERALAIRFALPLAFI